MYHHKKEKDSLLKEIHIEIFKNAVRQILHAAVKCSGRWLRLEYPQLQAIWIKVPKWKSRLFIWLAVFEQKM